MWDVKRRRAAPLFIPLLGERARVRGLRIPVPRASTAPSFSALPGTYKGWGEGSSGQPPLGLRWGERVGVKRLPSTVGEGRGKGLPGSVPPVGTSRWSAQPPPNPSPGGEGWGEGSSGQPFPLWRVRCGRSLPLQGWGEGLPGNLPGLRKGLPPRRSCCRPWPASGWPGSPTRSAPRPFRLAS